MPGMYEEDLKTRKPHNNKQGQGQTTHLFSEKGVEHISQPLSI